MLGRHASANRALKLVIARTTAGAGLTYVNPSAMKLNMAAVSKPPEYAVGV